MLHVHSPLPRQTETMIHDTIGCCIEVHRTLGPGLLEVIYSRAISLELTAAGLPFEREKAFPVTYRGELLCQQYLDFVVGGAIVLEIKAVDLLAPVHHAQLLSYLRVSRLRAGLLLNFNVAVLRDGLVRKVR